MATSDQFRVTKGTAARKNTGEQSSVHATAEAAANRAAQEAYLNGIISSYGEQIEAMKAEHSEQIEAIEKEHAEQVAQLKKDREEAIEEVKQKQQSAVDAEVVELMKQNRDLQSALQSARASNKVASQTAPDELTRYRAEIDAQATTHSNELDAMQHQIDILKDSHAKEVTKLKRQVGLEIHFHGPRGRKKRTYMLRPSTTFEVAIQSVCKAATCSFETAVFRYNSSIGQQIKNKKSTLEQVRWPRFHVLSTRELLTLTPCSSGSRTAISSGTQLKTEHTVGWWPCRHRV